MGRAGLPSPSRCGVGPADLFIEPSGQGDKQSRRCPEAGILSSPSTPLPLCCACREGCSFPHIEIPRSLYLPKACSDLLLPTRKEAAGLRFRRGRQPSPAVTP